MDKALVYNELVIHAALNEENSHPGDNKSLLDKKGNAEVGNHIPLYKTTSSHMVLDVHSW